MDNEKVTTFMDHLIELRKRLIVIAIALVIGMGVAWNFSGPVLTFVEKPLTGSTYLTVAKQRIYLALQERAPELYTRLQLPDQKSAAPRQHLLNYSAPLEPFFIECKISLLLGLILSLPVIFWQVWLFIAPGLTRKERRMVVPFVIAASLTFCAGVLFFLTIIWPVIINFSLSYEAEGLQSWFNISAYIDFCLRLILIFGLMFELPVLTLLLARLGIVNYRMLAPRRKYALLVSSIVAAFHADLITMFVIMMPMYLMYEISIWVSWLFGQERSAQTEPSDALEAG